VRVGIVGGGAAGLVSAWLLDEQHEVALFEKDDRLGGHAHTISVEADGQRVDVDAGFQFFAPGSAYATFNRLLDLLEVPRESYPATLTVYRTGSRQRPVVLPPVRGLAPVWRSLTPSAIRTMVRFLRFLRGVPPFLEKHDTTVTIAEYLAQQRLPRSFVDDFLVPLLLSFWCVERADFMRFAAYNALYYLGADPPAGISAPPQSQIRGGMKIYVDALAGGLQRTDVHQGTTVARVTRVAEGWVIEDAAGGRHPFDHVIVATGAHQAAALLGDAPPLELVRRQLRRFEYFDTTIAIHGDRRLMPRHESAWSVVNARWDGAHSQLSIWDPSRGLPIFKSWITFDDALPEPLYALATYTHGKITPDYFDAQRQLRDLQGRDGLWFAGLYADDADSHESAVRSAVTVAKRLSRDSPRLQLLLRAVSEGAD
jgi:predicted NAD/FAD-binding protein